MNLSIRNAETCDLRQINELAKQVQALHVELRPDIYLPNETIISGERFEELLDEGIVFVGEIDGKIISYAVCFINIKDNPLITRKKVLFVDAIGNDFNFRGCGIGRQMMEYIYNYAGSLSCDKLELHVNSNNKNAIEFYEHLGMTEKSKILEIDL